MRICSLELKKFRSITKTEKLDLSDFNVLIGPNNEGKSNILQALIIILEYLTNRRYNGLLDIIYDYFDFTNSGRPKKGAKTTKKFKPIKFELRRFFNEDYERSYPSYIWKRDFPLPLQKYEPDGVSEFNIKFELNKNDKKTLKTDAVDINKLKINLRFGKEYGYIEAINEGTNETLNTKKILMFLATNLRIKYIDTNRTSSTVRRIVKSAIEEELDIIKHNPKYRKAIKEIEILEKPVFKDLSKKISNGSKQFLPNIKRIKLIPKEPEAELESEPNIRLDDGEETDIEFKGDGVKSLLSMAIILESVIRLKDKKVILAIEEPESHLHPKAIRALKKTLVKLSDKNQVIITTHSPLLMDNYNIGNNIIVQDSEAKPAKSIAGIRNALGVELSDNLISARLAILVEGVHDIKILKSWLSSSKKIKKAIEEGSIIFEALNGASNLKSKASMYKAIGVDVYAFLDKDNEGINAEKEAKGAGLNLKVTFAGNSKQNKSEIEDLVKEEIYANYVNQNHNLSLNNKNFTKRKNKWSDRVIQLYEDAGFTKQEAEIIIPQLKKFISEQVTEKGRKSLKLEYKACIDNLQKNIEKYLDGKGITNQ